MRSENDNNSERKDKSRSGTNEISIITDEPLTNAPDLNRYSKTLSNIIVNSSPSFAVGIYGGWGTGKTTIMQMIRNHLDDEYNNTIITVWFDAWRYENEKFSALVPLVRTIILHLEEYTQRIANQENQNWARIRKLTNQFKKVGEVIIRNTSVNLGTGLGGAQFDFGKMIDDHKSDGSYMQGQEKILFHKHISEIVRDELRDIRGDKHETKKFRIVIFVDDLDRCTPQKALEILESIKTFFDIEGIIFVIGIDPSSIDPIIKTKYGENSKIDGMKYLQKIVQLPYSIPLWNPPHLSNTISNMIRETGLHEKVIKKVLDPKMQELIVKATELNPRDVKRFINSIVISQEIYGQGINDIEKIIVIQAFYFHGDKWVEFLKLLIPYRQRIEFVTHFILWLEKESTISNLPDLNSILQDDESRKKGNYVYKSLANKSLLYIYKKLVDIGDNDLFTFLKSSKETLLKIDNIERYLGVLDAIGPKSITIEGQKYLDIDSEKQSDLLRKREVTEFNKYTDQGIAIHLPYKKLAQCDLQNFRLDHSMLFRANLSKSNLYRANLTGAFLYGANLYKANLTEAILSDANLTGVDLPGANLSGAFLSGANLSGAFLYKVDLSGANMPKVDLSGANMRKVDLSGANLSGAKLLKTIIINCKFSDATIDPYTDFSNAIIDDPEFLNYLREKGLNNIPNEIVNKQQLKEELLNRGLTEREKEKIGFYISLSQLPER